MAYKDKDRQKQAVKDATRRYRAKRADSVLSSRKQGLGNAPESPVVDEVCDTHPVIPPKVIPKAQGMTVTQAEIDALPEDVKAAIAREPENERQIRNERAVRYQRLFSEHIELGTDLERCKHCKQPLPKLEQPRRYTGACLPCVMAGTSSNAG